MLGYGGTHKPKDPAVYKLKKMGEELMGLLDHLDIKQVVAIGHDCFRNFVNSGYQYTRGSLFLGPMANYFPE